MQVGSFSRLRPPKDQNVRPAYDRATESLRPPTRRDGRRSLHDAKDSKEVAWERLSSNHRREPSATSNRDRHFTIANVGDNGTIYLGYETAEKPSSSQDPTSGRSSPSVTSFSAYPPAFGLPPSPPTSADRIEQQDAPQYWHDALHESAAAYGTSNPQYPTIQEPNHRWRRSYSFSTADGQRNSSNFDPQLLHPGIRRRKSDRRPNTADLAGDMLHVPIPHYRIGTPRFSDGGNAYLRNSTMTIMTQDEKDTLKRSSAFSHTDFEKIFPVPPGKSHRETLPGAAVIPQSLTPASTPPLAGTVIDASIFDQFVVDADNPMYVKYSHDGKIKAATPARLVKQITSVKFLDYELLSDFFLTYRTFLPAKDLLRYLVARLRWAVHRDGSGRIVRVRTFVALRHWVLNYFLDDFEPNQELRALFCDLINELSVELQNRADGGGGDLQVVGELKKCWRRTCEMVWNTKHAGQAFPAGYEIVPSGETEVQADYFAHTAIAPHEQPSQGLSPNQHARPEQSTESGTGTNFFSQPFFQGRHQRYGSVDPTDVASFVVTNVSPAAAFRLRQESLDVTSCSVPLWKPFWLSAPDFRPKKIMPSAEKPTKKKAIGKTERPNTGRKRSGGLKKASQEWVPPLPTPKPVQTSKPKSHWPSGMLIRGILIQPASPNLGNNARTMEIAVDDNFQQIDRSKVKRTYEAGDSLNIQQRDVTRGLRRVMTNRLKSSEGERPVDSRMSNKAGPTLGRSKVPIQRLEPRADLLAIKVTEAYEDFINERQAPPSPPSPPSPVEIDAHGEADLATRTLYQSKALPAPPVKLDRLHSHMTTGSRSIVIVDDTGNAESDHHSDLHDRLTPLEHEPEREAPTREGYFELLGPGKYEPKSATKDGLEIPKRQSSLGLGISLGVSPIARGSHTARKPVPLSMDGVVAEPLVRASSSSAIATSAPSEWFESAFGPIPDHQEVSHDDDKVYPGSLRRSSLVDPSETDMTLPMNKLRRRPGGNLREVDNVQDLGSKPRRNSTGTIDSYGHSRTTSATISNEFTDVQTAAKRTNSRQIGFDADSNLSRSATKPSLKLMDSNTSKKAMRASFEMEVAKLARLAQYDDNGGVDSTLAKLEGKFSPSPIKVDLILPDPSPNEDDFPLPPSFKAKPTHVQVVGHRDHPRAGTLDTNEGMLSPRTDTQGASIYNGSQASQEEQLSDPSHTSPNSNQRQNITSHFDDRAAERDSWSRIAAPVPRRSSDSSRKWPVIQARDFALDGKIEEHGSMKTKADTKSVATPQSSTFLFDDSDDSPTEREEANVTKSPPNTHNSKPSHSTLGTKSQSTYRTKSSTKDSSTGARSFFFDEDDSSEDEVTGKEAATGVGLMTGGDLSDLSSDDEEGLQHAPVRELRHSPMPEKAAKRLRTPGPPVVPPPRRAAPPLRPNDEILKKIGLRDAASFPSPLPSPRIDRTYPPRIDSRPEAQKEVRRPEPNKRIPRLPPATSRSIPNMNVLPSSNSISSPPRPLPIQPPPQQPTHAPFILLYSSESLAKQLTLIEKDAISEVDWKELIDLKWQATPPKVRNWVEYMRQPNQSGVDIVIARFNLVVKWAVSEILLTDNATERARTIAKFIHTAAYAKRLKNYATTYQLTVALLSQAIQKLTRTWSMISPNDRQILAGLEQTVQPQSNFAKLRRETEVALHDPSMACIPFIGIYTHDLAYNAQKPAYLEPELVSATDTTDFARGPAARSVPGVEPLINFERFQTAAGVVKGVLKLLEASSRYSIEPNRECLGRCLWLAALSDEEITARGKSLEGMERAQRLGLV